MAATLEYSTTGTSNSLYDDWDLKCKKKLYTKLFSDNYIIKEKNYYDKTGNAYLIERPLYYTNDATTTATTPYIDMWKSDATSTATTYTLNDWVKDVGYYRWDKGEAEWISKPVDPMQRMREIIRSRQAPTILVARHGAGNPNDDREFRARETLRRMIGDGAFLRFLRKGFVSVRAKSGRVYQIFPGHKSTVCWENGKPIKSMCVILQGGFAPTDELIMRYILITTDEEDFWKRGNVWAAYPKSPQQSRTIDFRPLPEILAELKKKVA